MSSPYTGFATYTPYKIPFKELMAAGAVAQEREDKSYDALDKLQGLMSLKSAPVHAKYKADTIAPYQAQIKDLVNNGNPRDPQFYRKINSLKNDFMNNPDVQNIIQSNDAWDKQILPYYNDPKNKLNINKDGYFNPDGTLNQTDKPLNTVLNYTPFVDVEKRFNDAFDKVKANMYSDPEVQARMIKTTDENGNIIHTINFQDKKVKEIARKRMAQITDSETKNIMREEPYKNYIKDEAAYVRRSPYNSDQEMFQDTYKRGIGYAEKYIQSEINYDNHFNGSPYDGKNKVTTNPEPMIPAIKPLPLETTSDNNNPVWEVLNKNTSTDKEADNSIKQNEITNGFLSYSVEKDPKTGEIYPMMKGPSGSYYTKGTWDDWQHTFAQLDKHSINGDVGRQRAILKSYEAKRQRLDSIKQKIGNPNLNDGQAIEVYNNTYKDLKQTYSSYYEGTPTGNSNMRELIFGAGDKSLGDLAHRHMDIYSDNHQKYIPAEDQKGKISKGSFDIQGLMFTGDRPLYYVGTAITKDYSTATNTTEMGEGSPHIVRIEEPGQIKEIAKVPNYIFKNLKNVKDGFAYSDSDWIYKTKHIYNPNTNKFDAVVTAEAKHDNLQYQGEKFNAGESRETSLQEEMRNAYYRIVDSKTVNSNQLVVKKREREEE